MRVSSTTHSARYAAPSTYSPHADLEASSSQNASSTPSRPHIKGLDGLRAIAALAVLLYHTAPLLIPGGFLGVDVFFTLSGFLISSLLLADCAQHGRVHLWRFWLRRWRRLFPAVATVAIVTVPLAAIISPNLITRLPSQLAGTLTFSYNWISIATGNSYFDSMSPKLLTNMWTLSVEQQFYIVWPLAIALLYLCKRAIRPLISLALAAGSAALMAFYANGWGYLNELFGQAATNTAADGAINLSRVYMGTDSHAFGLMIGAALALAYANPLSGNQKIYRGYTRNFAGLFGIAGCTGLIFLFFTVSDSSSAVYPWMMLLATLCAALIIFSMTIPVQTGTSLATLFSALLDIRILRWLGVRSYGLYLWHWPLLVIWRYAFPHSPIALTSIVIISLSIMAAAFTYQFIENPMRHNGIFPTLFSWLKAHKIVTPIVCIAATAGLIIPAIFAPKYSQIEQALGMGEEKSSSRLSPSTPSPSPSLDADSNNSSTEAKTHSKSSKKATDDPQSTPSKQAKPQHRPEAEVRGENITIIGDSVMLAISQKAQEQWPSTIADGAVSRSYYAITPLIQQYNSQGNLRHFVVVGAANNGPIPPEIIEEWLQLIGPDRVLILVTGHGNAYTPWIADSNTAIHAAQKAHPEQIVIADWFTTAESNPQWLYEDLTHPNTEGIPQLISNIQGALEQASTLPNAYTTPQ